MLRTPRAFHRPAALLTPLLLVAALTGACGDETTVASGELQRTAAFEVSGDVGSSPEIAWKARMAAGEAETETITEGDGAVLEADDQVLVNYYVGNGFTKQTTLDTYTDEQIPTIFPVGGEVPQPSSPEPSQEQIARYLLDVFVAEQIEAGDTVGTRKVVTVTSADIIGVAGSALDIGNDDALLLVIDVDSIARERPDGDPVKTRPGWVPAITFDGATPTALRFDDADEPDGSLKKRLLYVGTGPEVAENDLILVNYLGQVYDSAKPFDASYGGEPFPTVIGQGAVVEGWDEGLIGIPVGSRVMLQIPAELGYGEAGQGESIPGDSTLYFLIDVLAAG